MIENNNLNDIIKNLKLYAVIKQVKDIFMKTILYKIKSN